jgi:hypothetical protein
MWHLLRCDAHCVREAFYAAALEASAHFSTARPPREIDALTESPNLPLLLGAFHGLVRSHPAHGRPRRERPPFGQTPLGDARGRQGKPEAAAVKEAIYLLPDAALFFVLARLVSLRLVREQLGLFVFLSAWFGYSLALELGAQYLPPGSLEYRKAFFLATVLVWCCALPALWAPGRVIIGSGWAGSAWRMAGVLAAAGATALLTRVAFARAGNSWSARSLAASAWLAIFAGAIFFAASFGMPHAELVLRRGAGLFFALYGFGILAAALVDRGRYSYLAVAVAGAIIWTATFYFLTPRPGLLFNPEKLGLVLPLRAAAPRPAFARRRNA